MELTPGLTAHLCQTQLDDSSLVVPSKMGLCLVEHYALNWLRKQLLLAWSSSMSGISRVIHTSSSCVLDIKEASQCAGLCQHLIAWSSAAGPWVDQCKLSKCTKQPKEHHQRVHISLCSIFSGSKCWLAFCVKASLHKWAMFLWLLHLLLVDGVWLDSMAQWLRQTVGTPLYLEEIKWMVNLRKMGWCGRRVITPTL